MVSKVKVDSIETTAGTGTIALNNQLSGMTVASLPTSGALPALDGSALTSLTSGNLSGALPAISGASLTNLPAGGVNGIASSANATAMTITSAEKIGIGTTSPVGSGVLNVDTASSTTNNLIHSLDVESHTTGTAANGVGTGIKFWGSMTGQNRIELGSIGFHNTNVSGANGDFVVLTRPNATSVERLRIDSLGRVTMPNLPCFRAYDTTTNSFTANTDFAFASTDFNNGSHYNTSNGKFTAPVTGYYTFSACFGTQGWGTGNTTQDLFTIRHNNSAICYSIKRENTDTANSANGFFTDYGNMIVYLAANDYVTVHAAYSSGNFKNRNYTWFCGALLG